MPLITLNRIKIDYSDPALAVKKLHNHVDVLREQVSYALANIDDNSNEFSIIKKSLNAQAGLILKASDSAASATLFASKVVNADGTIKAAEIVAAVNASGDTSIKLTADHISLDGMTEINGVTRMNGLAYVYNDLHLGDYQTVGYTRRIIFNDSARITANGSEITIVGSQLNFGDLSVPATNIEADGFINIYCGYTSSRNRILLEGRAATMITAAVNSAQLGGFTDSSVNIVGTLGLTQHVFLGAWDLANNELAFVIKVGTNSFRRFILTATREENI